MNTLSLAMRMAATLTGSSTVPPVRTRTGMRSRTVVRLLACALVPFFACDSAVMAQQVGVGTTTPANSAILDVSSTNKGVLFPRVALSSGTDQTTIPSPAQGLMVFNTGAAGLKTVGFVFWNGTEWRAIDNFSTTTPSATLDCPNASLEPAILTAGTAYTGYMRVPYFNGNGIRYSAGTPVASTGNTGLTATLLEGTLANGQGLLVFSVTGTPSATTPTGATFAVTFAGASCAATVGDVSYADILNIATVGPLVPTNDNGAAGWHQVITTPDGKFSIRAFIPKRTASWLNDRTYDQSNWQIRSNGVARRIVWLSSLTYRGGGIAGYSWIDTTLAADTWSGMRAGFATGDAVSATAPDQFIGELWADLSPNNRNLWFSEVNVATKVSYSVDWTFVGDLGATSGAGASYVTNVTNDALAAKSKNFFRLSQIVAK